MSVRPFPAAHPAESAAEPGPTVFREKRFQFIIWLRKTNQKFVDLNAELNKQKQLCLLCTSKVHQGLIQRELRWKCKFRPSCIFVSSYTRPSPQHTPHHHTTPLKTRELQSNRNTFSHMAVLAPSLKGLCAVSPAGITVGSSWVTVEAECSAGLWVTSQAVLLLTTGWRMKEGTAARAARCGFLSRKDGTIAGTAASSSAKSKMRCILFEFRGVKFSGCQLCPVRRFWFAPGPHYHMLSVWPCLHFLSVLYCYNCEIFLSYRATQDSEWEVANISLYFCVKHYRFILSPLFTLTNCTLFSMLSSKQYYTMLCAFAVLLKYSIPSVACYRDAFTDNTSCIVVFEPVIEAFVGVGLSEAVWSLVVLTKCSLGCCPCVIPGESPWAPVASSLKCGWLSLSSQTCWEN